MTERKPADMSFETWVDRAIRDAEERGAFADLPGAGKPIPGAGQPHDELWWVKAKMRQENLAFVPPSLALRKEVEAIHEVAAAKRSEPEVRQLVEDLNARIVAAIRTGISGPAIVLTPLNPDQVVAAWRDRRGSITTNGPAGPTTDTSTNGPAGPTTDTSTNRPAEPAADEPSRPAHPTRPARPAPSDRLRRRLFRRRHPS